MSPKIQIIKRDSKTFTIRVVDACGVAINITGYTVYFTVKSQANIGSNDGTAIIRKVITSHTNPTAGLTAIPLTSTDTNQTIGEYFYDIQMKSPTGAISSCVKGKCEILQDITASI
jgi:hypothetical protein